MNAELIAIKRMILDLLPGDFAKSSKALIRNLQEFDRNHEAQIEKAFANLEHNETVDKDLVRSLVGIAELEKTVGNALAKGVIIVTSSYIKSAARKSNLNEDQIFSAGPVVKGVNWAQAIETAGNYIRHMDEWDIPSHTLIVRGEQIISRKVKNLIGHLPTPKAKRNAEILRKLGLKPDQIVGPSTDSSFKLAKQLDLHDFELTNQRYLEWIRDIRRKIMS